MLHGYYYNIPRVHGMHVHVHDTVPVHFYFFGGIIRVNPNPNHDIPLYACSMRETEVVVYTECKVALELMMIDVMLTPNDCFERSKRHSCE